MNGFSVNRFANWQMKSCKPQAASKNQSLQVLYLYASLPCAFANKCRVKLTYALHL